MLSRIADSLYWMSRYLERVDSTARLMEINLIYMLEAESQIPEAAEWRPLLAISGQEEAYKKINGEEVTAKRAIDFLVRSSQHAGSIRSSLRLARENARVVRDRISQEMWECLNQLWLDTDAQLRTPLAAEKAPAFCRAVRSQVARFHGLTVSTMMRGEAFGFYLLGFFLERSDMTARILDVKYHLLLPDLAMVGSALDYYQWASLLRSVSAYEPFRRKYHTGMRPLDVAEFMILEPDLPRSLRFAADRMRQALEEIGLVENAGGAQRALTALDSLLANVTADSIFAEGLHEFLEEFVARVGSLHEAIADDYFEAHLGEAACAT